MCSKDSLMLRLPFTRRHGRTDRKKVGVSKLSGFKGGGVDHVPPSMLRRGRGNKGGLFSLSVLVGRLFSPLPCRVCAFVCASVWLCVGGVMQGLR